MGEQPRIIVFCPLEFERRSVVRALSRAGGAEAGSRSRVVTTGPGAEAVAREVRKAHEDGRADAWFVLAGVAGGLRDGLMGAPGIGRVVDAAGTQWRPDIAAGPCTIVGVDAIAATPAAKRGLRERTGADLVDTESHGFARACAELGVHWGVVRGVSDGPGDALPPEVVGWVDQRGRTRGGRVVMDVLRRPRLVRELPALGKRSGAAMAAVGAALIALAEEQSRMMEMMRPVLPIRSGTVILFGGSFDPPHRGHVELPERVRAEVEQRTGEPAWLIYVPAGRSPFKAGSAPAPARDRLEMVAAAIGGSRRAAVADVEIARAEHEKEGVSYTVDTVRWARERLPAGARLRLLIGADQAAEFHRWKQAREIVSLAEPLVMLRGPVETADALIERMRASGAWSEEELAAWRGRVVDVGTMDVSATAVREAAARGEWERVEAMTGPGVARIIRERGVYGGGTRH